MNKISAPVNNAYNSLVTMKNAIKNLPKNPTQEDYKKISELAEQTCKLAENEIELRYENNKLANKVDKSITRFFEKFSRLFNKKGGYKTANMGNTLLKAVLIGNILKDLVTGVVSTSQSFTNPDYSKSKRMFMGSYDVMACLTTITLSFILGPMSINKINNGFKKILKPIEKTPKYNFVLTGLSGFTAIILQSIVAKRAIAPAISTPLAGIMKNHLMKNENKETD